MENHLSIKEFMASEVVMTATAFAKTYNFCSKANEVPDKYFVFLDKYAIRKCTKTGVFYINSVKTEGYVYIDAVHVIYKEYLNDTINLANSGIEHKTRKAVEVLFQEIYSEHGVSGDIGPDEDQVLDSAIDNIVTILQRGIILNPKINV